MIDGNSKEAAAPQPTTGPEGWAANRRQWRHKRRAREEDDGGDGSVGADGAAVHAQRGAVPLDACYESLLGHNRPFDHPILLKEMVEFLTEVWLDEGLYG
ncbi:4-diphosphocytidyl-2-C-methyl-D-erythritol kinase [Micractinium conductrix]|uniref:4-diphosphocytidyl-2-C-methyl-D-erythritol kinase n=1 Tax=Micractinium conductrix TaxID=554055 RepID=A0A2P6VNE6_9CHLO|nr:4-diphosphocytidyl-2-C-methyl-D-erythritol kinase [Micractinium conductrix]|eukprot:PSC75599.1 4-diphosphocytidyl-2-C-methyl-D-erythritol kinase [Micractinium conductrix]